MSIYKSLLAGIALLAVSCTAQNERGIERVARPADYVSTLVGTQSDYSFSAGNTYPATALPWGMNFWTPQTGKMGDGWTYTYSAHKIRGFKQTHQPSPWINDYGQFSLMPVRDASLVDEEARASWFTHKTEIAKPYSYKVYLADHDIYAEVAPTERAAVLRFTYPDSDSSALVIDAFDRGSGIRIDPATGVVSGYTTRNSGGVPENFRNWFVVRLDKPVDSWTLYDRDREKSGSEVQGEHALIVLKFKTKRGEQVQARVASSFISPEQAVRNLDREIGKAGFDAVEARAKERWNDILGRIKVGGGTEDQLRTFYSCLYRSVLFPHKFYEIDATGVQVHYSPYDGQVHAGPLYTDTGFWDTFRALFPLLNLVYPDVNKEIQLGMVNIAKENPYLPEWASPGHRGCMIGNNSASVVADAAVKGVSTTDLDTLYRAIVYGTTNYIPEINSTGRYGHDYYNTLGYIPYDVGIRENVARTLEYAYDDWCILQLAKQLGRPQEELDRWAARALNYRNVFDPETRLMRGRNRDGSFQTPFSPYKWGDAFTEGNSWHYTWSVFHDVRGLIDLMGGDDAFNRMLDSVFVVPPIYDDSYYGFCIHEIKEMQVAHMGNYAHGNQPAQHMAYLYDWSGQPWKTQQRVREIMDKLYDATPTGYCGDEDNGQTSAWYVFSALGFYPVCPGSDQYALGGPLFKRAEISLAGGKTLTIRADDNAPDRFYVGGITRNGKSWTRTFVEYGDLMTGGTLSFRMIDQPDKHRSTAPEDRPYSFSNSEK